MELHRAERGDLLFLFATIEDNHEERLQLETQLLAQQSAWTNPQSADHTNSSE